MINKFDLIGYLSSYCLTNDIVFVAGETEYQNVLADQNLMTAGKLFMGVAFSLQPNFSDSSNIESVLYSGRIFLGRKTETSPDNVTTVSNLDETFYQKYTARLRELSEMLCSILQNLQCEEDCTVVSCNIEYALNQLDLNLDGVIGTVSLRFE